MFSCSLIIIVRPRVSYTRLHLWPAGAINITAAGRGSSPRVLSYNAAVLNERPSRPEPMKSSLFTYRESRRAVRFIVFARVHELRPAKSLFFFSRPDNNVPEKIRLEEHTLRYRRNLTLPNQGLPDYPNPGPINSDIAAIGFSCCQENNKTYTSQEYYKTCNGI